jgi:hypothetical protein
VKVIRPIDVVATRVPLVQIDAAQVDDPEQGGEVVHDGEVDDVAGGVLDRAGLDPLRPGSRRPLHEEEVAGGALRVALHHHRAAGEVGKQHGRNLEVVAEEIALGKPKLWPEGLLQIGQPHHAAADLDDGQLLTARDVRRRRRPRRFR